MHILSLILPLGVILMALPLAVTDSITPGTPEPPDPDLVVCIYRISGTYGPFTRWLYYASMVSAFTFRRYEWLSTGLMAWVMLYSSSAVAHLWILLCDTGLHPEIIDFDIFPITTLLMATFIITAASIFFSKTARSTKAAAIIHLWSWWMMLGVWPCFVMISFYYADLQARQFSEPVVCLGNGIDRSTPLISPTQLLNPPNPITCTYQCFSSHTSRIRDAEEIFIVPESVLYVPVLQVMVLVVVTLWTSTFILSYAIDAGCLRGRVRKAMNRTWLLRQAWALLNASSGPIGIAIGETFILRNERMLKTENFKGVGQWTAFIGVFFVIFASLLDHYVLEPRRLAGKAPIPTFRDFVKFCFGSCLRANRQADDVELAVVHSAHDNAAVPANPTTTSNLLQVNTVGLVAQHSSNQARNNGCSRRHSW